MIPEKSRFLIFALGIFFCYFLYGIVQEKITRGRYGQQINEDGSVGERFSYALALVWVQCFCNFVFAKGLLTIRPQKDDTTHSGYYAVSALTYLLAMVSSNMALRWVPYPTQVVGKSAKPIPVMILGVLLGRKSYSWIRYACVITIVVGVVLFMYKEGKTPLAAATDNRTGLGELLLILSLSMDGLTGAVQERMRSSSAPSGQQMMFAMNFWSTLMLGFAMIATGEGKDFIHFATRHPELWGHLALLALCGCLGQLFIFLMVAGFGPLACSVVTTTRKFFTVLCSVIFFGNILIPRQWFGAVLVFAGLFADMFYGKKPAAAAKKPSITKDKDFEDKKKLLS
ncbi:putative solute carrier family 35 member B1 [Lucilia cuprina]|uniref:Putative solute carrier family 35 member B1 n=1 Tax=Lucilia cuprina TaxID=7375 RepID=A0A0L0BYG1_LUCCU|nr:solute carrier family 35 member B1 homolog [Lucilia cuprina]KAI8129372.1 Solute carrier family 35 member B1 like protein [Lucilia cuprina]KNC24309.1 putative solute carrier family 35 member B1 [Lucilia cuprina]